MNTSYRNTNRYQSLLNRPSQSARSGYAQNRATSQEGRSRYSAYVPSSQDNQPGIYNRRQLMRAVRGGYGGNQVGSSCCCKGHHGVGRPSREQRRDALNNRLTDTFNKLGEAFPRGKNAVDRLAGDKERSTLVDLLGKNDLVGAVQDLEKKGPVTVLAPSNKAFADLAKKQPELFKKLTDPRNKKALQDVLLYHVSDKRTDFSKGGVFDSLLSKDQARFFGNPFSGSIANGNQRIRTGLSSVSANGSVVIPVDQVLIPPGFDPSKLL